MFDGEFAGEVGRDMVGGIIMDGGCIEGAGASFGSSFFFSMGGNAGGGGGSFFAGSSVDFLFVDRSGNTGSILGSVDVAPVGVLFGGVGVGDPPLAGLLGFGVVGVVGGGMFGNMREPVPPVCVITAEGGLGSGVGFFPIGSVFTLVCGAGGAGLFSFLTCGLSGGERPNWSAPSTGGTESVSSPWTNRVLVFPDPNWLPGVGPLINVVDESGFFLAASAGFGGLSLPELLIEPDGLAPPLFGGSSGGSRSRSEAGSMPDRFLLDPPEAGGGGSFLSPLESGLESGSSGEIGFGSSGIWSSFS